MELTGLSGVTVWLISQTVKMTHIKICEPGGSCLFQSGRVEESLFRPQQIEYLSSQYSKMPEKECMLRSSNGEVIYCLLSDAISAYRSLPLKNKSNL